MFKKTKNTLPAASMRTRESSAPSIIAHDINVLGNIVSEGTVDFAGSIDGNIHCKTLTIRPHGVVSGEIAAETVHIYGKVRGLIRAKHVHLYEMSHIEGIVMHESITIKDGAFIDGKCKRTDKPMQEQIFEAPPMPFAADSEEDTSSAEIKVLKNFRLISQ